MGGFAIMKDFRNIAYVSSGENIEQEEGLKQALSLARNNSSDLKILVVNPEFPRRLSEHKKNYEAFLQEKLENSVNAVKSAIGLETAEVKTAIEISSDKTPAIGIIKKVIKDGYDLVIKSAQKNKHSGFKSIDLQLVRKCPVPVWLCKPIKKHREQMKIAVAIDPSNASETSERLSRQLLDMSRTLADTCDGHLNIISCWDYEDEAYIRDNVFMKVSNEEIADNVQKCKEENFSELQTIIDKSEISGSHKIHQLRGQADNLIPEITEKSDIDVLVMGTVARTGIAGLLIGNTAEDIIRELNCSLLAVKPNGFVSPVKP